MVNKHVLRETFMKLESYDRVNVISDILKLSNSLELEFYSSVIESILQYHKLSVNTLREELNHENNLKCFINSDCTDSNVRSKLISTLSLLKASNINGASQIFEFIRQNHIKLKEQAHKNPSIYEEVLLIYQLANDHPAFSFNHCQEIFDYLNQIRSISVSRDYFNASNNDEYINDLSVISIEKNDKQQFVYRIKVKWDHGQCCIIRTLEDVYHFYKKLFELFPLEIKNGEVCCLYMSFFPDNLDISFNLMSTFFRDFLKSPQSILQCDFVRQFFKPKTTDKNICDCSQCHTDFNKLHWTGDRKFDPVNKCIRQNNPSDNDECSQRSFDNKADIFSSSHPSSDSKCHNNDNHTNLSITDSIINNQSYSEDGSESSVKFSRKKIKKYHSTGSSPINTPSDESETCSKNESLKNQTIGYSSQLSMVIENAGAVSSSKDIRTENWLSQSNKTINDEDPPDASPQYTSSNIEHCDFFARKEDSDLDLSNISHCQIGNLNEWLKSARLHKYHYILSHMTFGKLHSVTEEKLNDFGFVEGASKKLVALIRRIKQSDIIIVNQNQINIAVRERSNSTDSWNSAYSSGGEYVVHKSENQFLEPYNRGVQVLNQPYGFPILMPSNFIVLPPNIIHNFMMMSPENTDQINTVKQCGHQ